VTRYRRSTYLLPAELEDDLVADLWQAGTLGVQSTPLPDGAPGRVRVEAWFPGESPEDLGEVETLWRERGAETLGSETVPESDWLALWRRGARPIPVGSRLLLDPREPGSGDGAAERAAATGRHLLRLPARRAFGTGSHETTRLVLLFLEHACRDARTPPQRVLDVGTGTGVLAFAALLFGVPRVVAFDRDPLAVFMARDNARLNEFGTDPSRPRAPSFFVGTAESLAVDGGFADEKCTGFDLVLVNILPHLVEPDLPRLLRTVAPGGAVVVAGMPSEEGPDVSARLADLGFEATDERREGAWVAYRFERARTERRTEAAE
jgi:ribosomal protein L11 methyltransferase